MPILALKKSLQNIFIDILHFSRLNYNSRWLYFSFRQYLDNGYPTISKLQYKYHISIKFVILIVNCPRPDLLNKHSKKHASKA